MTPPVTVASTLAVGLGTSRALLPNSVERQLDRTNTEQVAIKQRCWRLETPVRNECSILAAEIFNGRLFSGDPNQRMTSRDAGGIEKQLEIGISSQYVLAVTEACAAVRP